MKLTTLFEKYYRRQGNFKVHAYAFDVRNYAEAFLDIAILDFPCMMPTVWIEENHTSWDKWELIPAVKKSIDFQVQANTFHNCSIPVETR